MKQDHEARQQILEGMRACTPPECPLPFSEIIAARFSKKQTALAEVKMFDGLLGVLEISQVPFGLASTSWCLEWKKLPGGAINWNGAEWERVSFTAPEAGSKQEVVQATLFDVV